MVYSDGGLSQSRRACECKCECEWKRGLDGVVYSVFDSIYRAGYSTYDAKECVHLCMYVWT